MSSLILEVIAGVLAIVFKLVWMMKFTAALAAILALILVPILSVNGSEQTFQSGKYITYFNLTDDSADGLANINIVANQWCYHHGCYFRHSVSGNMMGLVHTGQCANCQVGIINLTTSTLHCQFTHTGENYIKNPFSADINNDGIVEVIIASGINITVIDENCNFKWTQNVSNVTNDGKSNYPAVGNFTNDAGLEVAFAASGGRFGVLNGTTGAVIWDDSQVLFQSRDGGANENHMAVGDMDADGMDEFCMHVTNTAYTSLPDNDNYDFCFDDGTSEVQLWNSSAAGSEITKVAVYYMADLAPDAGLELFEYYNEMNVFNSTGSTLWSKTTFSETETRAGWYGDVDGDGSNEVIVGVTMPYGARNGYERYKTPGELIIFSGNNGTLECNLTLPIIWPEVNTRVLGTSENGPYVTGLYNFNVGNQTLDDSFHSKNLTEIGSIGYSLLPCMWGTGCYNFTGNAAMWLEHYADDTNFNLSRYNNAAKGGVALGGWFNISSTADDEVDYGIVSIGNYSQMALYLDAQTNHWHATCMLMNGTKDYLEIANTQTLLAGSWNYAQCIVNSSHAWMVVNSTESAVTSMADYLVGGIPALYGINNSLMIGYTYGKTNFLGLIDDVMVRNYTLNRFLYQVVAYSTRADTFDVSASEGEYDTHSSADFDWDDDGRPDIATTISFWYDNPWDAPPHFQNIWVFNGSCNIIDNTTLTWHNMERDIEDAHAFAKMAEGLGMLTTHYDADQDGHNDICVHSTKWEAPGDGRPAWGGLICLKNDPCYYYSDGNIVSHNCNRQHKSYIVTTDSATTTINITTPLSVDGDCSNFTYASTCTVTWSNVTWNMDNVPANMNRNVCRHTGVVTDCASGGRFDIINGGYCTGSPYATGDWNIALNTTCTDQELTVTGNIFLSENAYLTLAASNITLDMSSYYILGNSGSKILGDLTSHIK